MQEQGSRRDEGPAKNASRFAKVGKYAAIGFEFPSTIIGGLFLGQLLDRYFGTFPWLTTTATLLALFGAFIRLVQWSQRFSKKDK